MTNAAPIPVSTQKLPRKDKTSIVTASSNRGRKSVQGGAGGIIINKKVQRASKTHVFMRA